MIDLSKIDLNKLDKLLQKEKGLALISLKELQNLINNQKKYLPIVDLTKKEKEIFDYVWRKKIIMGQPEGLVNTMLSVKYIINQNIGGDFVECGVWQGGHALAAKMLFELYNDNRTIWLFDTFEGMTKPTEFDIKTLTGKHAATKYEQLKRKNHNEWCYASFELVRSNLINSGVDISKIEMIKGDVSKTLKNQHNVPKDISILRLDTDFYQSTKDELEILYPNLRKNGVLILDDYGSWNGVQKATDEFFHEYDFARPFLQMATLSAGVRCGIKI